MRHRPTGVLLLGVLLSLFLAPATSRPGDPGPASVMAGQTATVLPDGRWLLVGGAGPTGAAASATIWDPPTQTATPVSGHLQRARAWHTATMLPDGTVLILGGVDAAGRVVAEAERFSPATGTFERLPDVGLTPRASHTATLLTDGHVLIAGGISDQRALLGSVQLWDTRSGAIETVPAALSSPRQRHTATLLADGGVLLWGGFDRQGVALATGEQYDPQQQRFTVLATPPLDLALSPDAPRADASLPADGANGIPADSLIALRFSKPLRADTLTSATVTLAGPTGVEETTVVPAEGGMLAFITPRVPLQPGTYTLLLNGAVDQTGLPLPLTQVRFTTEGRPSGTLQSGAEGGPGGASPPGSSSGSEQATSASPASNPENDDWVWRGERRDGRPYSPWQSLPPLRAAPGVTALAGQMLRLNGEPLADVTLGIGGSAARTDDTGRFLLMAAPGVHELLIDGRSANAAGRTYGLFEVNVELLSGQTVVLPYTVWMPKLDLAHAVTIPAYTTSEVVVTTPRIPGLELRIPAHAAIRDHEGRAVTQVSITPIPLDRPPFPLPQGVDVPLYFTVQPGGAYVASRYAAGARLIYPNSRQQPPGTRFEFWDYDPERKGWHIYGQGRVTEDGRQVVPDPGVAIYEFSGAMVATPGWAPALWAAFMRFLFGDPVDGGTGLFILEKTDVALPDVLPIRLTRTYRPEDSMSRAFGIGASHLYEMFLVGNTLPWTWQDLVLADGTRVHYERISPGTSWGDAVYEHTTSPTRFYKSRIAWNGTGWDLTLKDGTVYVFPDPLGAVRPSQAAVKAIRDRYGNALTLTREASGNLTRIASPHGRWIELAYDSSYRITQAKDNIGRIVTYTYDGSGRLWKVTDPAGGVTEYTYDAAHRMLTIKDPRGIVFLTNEYDGSGRVIKQTQADGTFYQFAYTVDGGTGKIVQTDVTDPRGIVARATYNTSGYPLSLTRALGRPEQQAATIEWQAGSNLELARTDALSRRTASAYDAMGNLTSLTRLAGTPQAVTTSFTWEPSFNQVASVTDPLNHTTTFAYDSLGNVTTITDSLSHQTSLTYNPAGQPVSVTDPAGTTQLTYDLGDLVSLTDPLGNTTTRFIDGAGRLLGLTSPLGHQTRYDYDALNQLKKITDPLGGVTQFSYDPNGNLLSLTDARTDTTSWTYNNMDRVATRTDPLIKSESFTYDNNGNPATHTDRKSQMTSATYDGLGRRTQVAYADTSTTSYTWDAGNRLTQIVDSISGTITRTYDGLDRLTQEVTPQGTVSYTYDAATRRATMTVLGQPTVTYTYDNADRLTQITQGTSTVTIGYDSAGRRTSLTLSNGVVTEYGYDTASRLTGLTYKNGPTILGTLTYTYDAAGNRESVGGSWARTGLPQVLASATYNAGNQQVAFGGQTLIYDLNGNLTSDGTTTYTWDARNRLATLSGPGLIASFQYDPLGRRTQKTINGTATGFHYDGLTPVQELNGAAVVANLLTGLGIDEYFTRADAAGAHSHLVDALGSTIAELDAALALQAEHTYEPFGLTTTTGATGNTFQYTGRENDGTGLYYYRARYYHPTLQRFISEDPIGFLGGNRNLYGYVGNSPTNWSDPFGLQAVVPMPTPLPIPIPWPQYIPGTPENEQLARETANALRDLWDKLRQAWSEAFPDPSAPPEHWIPHPSGAPNTWVDPKTGEVWHWHPDPTAGHGGDHWDIGGPRGPKGEKGKQDWWPRGGKRGPKPPGSERGSNVLGVPLLGCRKC